MSVPKMSIFPNAERNKFPIMKPYSYESKESQLEEPNISNVMSYLSHPASDKLDQVKV
jgi:hypothetical protein